MNLFEISLNHFEFYFGDEKVLVEKHYNNNDWAWAYGRSRRFKGSEIPKGISEILYSYYDQTLKERIYWESCTINEYDNLNPDKYYYFLIDLNNNSFQIIRADG